MIRADSPFAHSNDLTKELLRLPNLAADLQALREVLHCVRRVELRLCDVCSFRERVSEAAFCFRIFTGFLQCNAVVMVGPGSLGRVFAKLLKCSLELSFSACKITLSPEHVRELAAKSRL